MNVAELKAEAAIDDALGFGTYRILHEFACTPPRSTSSSPIRVPADAGAGAQGDLACPDEYKYWRRGGKGDQVLETHQSSSSATST